MISFFFLFLPMTAVTITTSYACKVGSIATWGTLLVSKGRISLMYSWAILVSVSFDSAAEWILSIRDLYLLFLCLGGLLFTCRLAFRASIMSVVSWGSSSACLGTTSCPLDFASISFSSSNGVSSWKCRAYDNEWLPPQIEQNVSPFAIY